MKKIIVTRKNYEEVMFNLLEDTYPADVRENVLDQVYADTFLSFEWQQWSKAVYSESTEPVKTQEAEFIESLTKEELKKRGLVYYIVPLAAAACLVLLFVILSREDVRGNDKGIVKASAPYINYHKPEAPPVLTDSIIRENREHENKYVQEKRGIAPVDTAPLFNEPVPEMKVQGEPGLAGQVRDEVKSPAFDDTISRMVAEIKKKARYKVTITQEESDEIETGKTEFTEKRYSMTDVLNHKDGISLSRFLKDPSSRIVKNKSTNAVTIECMGSDHTILVLVLSE